jgi:hypothetical protein
MVAVAEKSKTNQPQDGEPQSASAWSYRLVRNAVFSVTGAFILVMGLFAWLEVFNTDNAANVTAALSSLFGIVGTLVGAYFGIKASSDAQDRSADTAQQAVTVQRDTAAQAVTHQKETAQQAVADQKETAQQAVEKTAAAASGTSNKTGAATPMSVALATLIPIAGGAGLIVLRHYLKRM